MPVLFISSAWTCLTSIKWVYKTEDKCWYWY